MAEVEVINCKYCGFDNPASNMQCFNCGAKLEHPPKPDEPFLVSSVPHYEPISDGYAPSISIGKNWKRYYVLAMIAVLFTGWYCGILAPYGFPGPYNFFHTAPVTTPPPNEYATTIAFHACVINASSEFRNATRVDCSVYAHGSGYTLLGSSDSSKEIYLNLPSSKTIFCVLDIPTGHTLNVSETVRSNPRIVDVSQSLDVDGDGLDETVLKMNMDSIPLYGNTPPIVAVYGIIEVSP